MNFPTWIEDSTAVPAAALVRVKKAAYIIGACNYAFRLVNAGYRWVRGATDVVPDPQTGQVLDADDIAILQNTFPSLWAGYPGTWPTPPAKAVVDTYVETVWRPRKNELDKMMGLLRQQVASLELSWIDWDGLID